MFYNGSIKKRGTHSVISRVRQLVATWCRSENAYVGASFTSLKEEDDSFLRVSWEARGGVWILSTTREEAGDKDVAIVHNALNIEERCKAIAQIEGFLCEPRRFPRLRFSDI